MFDTDALLADIDKSLGKTPKKKTEESEESEEEIDQDEMKPRNYHPPDSPVRRVYENGVEISPRMENAASQTRSESVLAPS